MQTTTVFELLHETGKSITSEIELEKVVQRVTDIATELIKAQFGAFFYNVTNKNGESLVLYTISGVLKEAFSKFPMPRNTKIFEPTFMAKGTVRYADVTKEAHYGQNAPYFGMPKGHLPVRSYLAVPVVSPITKEAIGGLFFGHSEPGIFTEEAEKLTEGVALQAAIAMTNARLFEEKKQSEIKLREERQQYQSIFNATSDSAIIYDEQGYIVEANHAACQIFQYNHVDLIGIHAGKLFKHPEDFEALKEIALSGRQYNGINTRVKKDGTLFEAEFTGVRFIFKGTPHVLSVSREVTSKKIETILLKNEDVANTITNVSPVALWMTNELGETVYINQIWLDWVGRSLSSQLGTGWLNSLPAEDSNKIKDDFFTAFKYRKVFTFDFRVVRSTREIRWCTCQGTPFFNKDGSFGGYAGSITDITERKLAEEKLESQNVLISTIANNTQHALFLMNERQVCTYMNTAAEEMTGFKVHEVQEKPLHFYIHHTHPDGRHFPIEDCLIDRALPTKHQTKGEEVFVHRNGNFYPVSFTASPIIEKGKPIGTVIEAKDITEEKRLQQELQLKEKQAMAMLEEKVKERTQELENTNYELLQFTSIASHDLKEPVRKISLFSKRIKDSHGANFDESLNRYLNTIINSAERMAKLIDDLLSFSRLSHTSTLLEAVDLALVLKGVLEDLEILIKEKEATINFSALPTVKGNPLQLRQVFQNLLSNSLKFSHPERKPLIQINAVQAFENDVMYEKISFQDNGIGFNPEYAPKIFEIFQRLHSRDEFEGTGIGLAIVKKVVSFYNGIITAHGKEGVGALFEVYFPR